MLTVTITAQWIMPIVKSSVKPFEEMDYGKMVERIMALAVSGCVQL